MSLFQDAREFVFAYRTSLPASDAAIDVWVPVPVSDSWQEIGTLRIEAPCEVEDNVEKRSGNRMLHMRAPRSSAPTTLSYTCPVKRHRRRVEPPAAEARYTGALDLARYSRELAPDANVPIDGFIGYQARIVASRNDPPVIRARKIFDHLIRTLEYDWAGCTPDRIHELGNLAQACDLRKGTCTEFHGLYVGYARALGIPAKFCFGFNVADDKDASSIAGYHCWAEILLPEVGWFPVDVTEAIKALARGHDKEASDFFFGGLHCHRVQVSTGRDLALEPRQEGRSVDKFVFSYAASGEEPIEPSLEFSFEKLPTQLREGLTA